MIRIAAFFLALALTAVVTSAQVKLDKNLPNYRPTSGVSGSIKSVGSDTMNNLMTLWAETFKKHYPSVRVSIEGKGSSTAPPALISGSSTFGPMSRRMKTKEMDKFNKKFGYDAIQLETAIDMLAVYVHKDNPISGLSLQQVDAIFSKNRKLGHSKDIRTWGDLGLTGEWANKPISIYGRNAASGTYGFFKKKALGKGDYKDSVKEQPGSSSVVQSVARDRYAIGYSGIGYKTADVRAVSLCKKTGDTMVHAEASQAYSGKYPLSRFLLLTVNYKPGTRFEKLRAEFIKLIYSKEGQEAVLKDGYFPVTSFVANKNLRQVGLKAKAKNKATIRR